MLIDIHAHIWGNRLEESKESICRAITMYGIDRVYVSGLQRFSPDEEEIQFLNREVAGFMKEHPLQIGGAVYVNPQHSNTMDILKRALFDDGFELIKLWVSTFADDPSVDPIMVFAAENGIPVLFHAFRKSTVQVENESTGTHIAAIARRHPDTKIIMAHLGGNCYDGIPAIRSLKNVWCDISGSIFRGDELSYALEQVGAERILFGTDMPCSPLLTLGQISGAPLSQSQWDLICFQNAEKILDRRFRLNHENGTN